jgi:hypothetical protein
MIVETLDVGVWGVEVNKLRVLYHPEEGRKG